MSAIYDERERRLVDLAVSELGADVILRDNVVLDWRDSEPVLVDGPTGHSLSLGADGRLWCRMVKSGTVLVGIIENGSIKPLAEGPAGGHPSAN